MDEKLDLLRKQLNGASVSDDMIARGVNLTPKGERTLRAKLGVNGDDLAEMLDELRRQMKAEDTHTGLPASPDIMEDHGERFEYEADFMGNVTLRDTKTGHEHYLQGSEGAKFLREVERVGIDYQGLIAPYFTEELVEFQQLAKNQPTDADNGGTYNFPFQGNFAVARFWLDGDKPRVEVVSILDMQGEEIPVDEATKKAANAVAWEWVNKV